MNKIDVNSYSDLTEAEKENFSKLTNKDLGGGTESRVPAANLIQLFNLGGIPARLMGAIRRYLNDEGSKSGGAE